MDQPRIIEGGIGIDDRGSVAFVNGFGFEAVKRFYLIRNHRVGFVRAWHAHRREAKYIAAVSGSALVGAVPIENFDSPDPSATVVRVVLSAGKPAVFYVPAGYANGFMSLSEDAILAFFSTATVEESKLDDVRFDARLWDIWKVQER